jgi:hypothetical protein
MKTTHLGELLGYDEDIRAYKPDSNLIKDANYFVGLELELEDAPVDPEKLPHWKLIVDGSLRGAYAIELISRYPYKGSDIVNSLEEMESYFKNNKITPSTGPRTSVHVHVDVRDCSYQQYLNIIVLYAIVEDLLFYYCGENRRNSIYCIPWSEAEAQVDSCENLFSYLHGAAGQSNSDRSKTQIVNAIRKFSKDERKYSALNLAATHVHGSVEFRMHPGSWDAKEIIRWVNILLCIKKFSMNFEDASQNIIYKMSIDGPEKFMEEVFNVYAEYLKFPNYELSLLSGARLAQEMFNYGSDCPEVMELFNEMKVSSIEESPVIKYARNCGLDSVLIDPLNVEYERMRNSFIKKDVSADQFFADPGLANDFHLVMDLEIPEHVEFDDDEEEDF